MTRDERRSARLLFARELEEAPLDLDARAVRRAVKPRPAGPRPVRIAQRAAEKLGWLRYEQAIVAPMMRARRALLGDAAAGPPRVLVRVDEFPHYLAHGRERFGRFYGTEHFLRFHEAMMEAAIPYLVAVSPRVSYDPLDPDDDRSRPLDDGEVETLRRLAADGVELALHGRTHRTRFAEPSRHSELCGLEPAALDELLDSALAELAELGIEPSVFVPPYNRFDAAQYDTLARRFDIVCGGPENVALLGYQRTPMWRGDAVYMPSYAPFYGDADTIAPALARVADASVWIPVALHWGWDYENGWEPLPRLTAALAPYSRPWSEFQAEMQASALDV